MQIVKIIFNIGEYSFSPNRVIWSRMSNDMRAAVSTISPSSKEEKSPIATDTTSFVSAESEIEAHYICALLNSTPIREFIKSFSSAGRGFGAPSVLSHVSLSKFDDKNKIHVKLAELSIAAHNLTSVNDIKNAEKLEKEIDEIVYSLFS